MDAFSARTARLAPLALPALLALAGPLRAQAPPEDGAQVERYATIARGGAVVRNLAGETGVEIARPEQGTLVRVSEDVAGWLEIETPGGFPVFVFGRYLAPTAEAGVYEVTRNAVNMRPRAASDVNSFPLPQRLHAGDRVRAVEAPVSTVELADSWVRVWSPPGVRAYLRSSDAALLEDGIDGAARWAAALAALPSERSAPAGTAATDAPVEGPRADEGPDAKAALEAARRLLESENAKSSPNFGAVRRALDAVLQMESTGAVAVEARHQLQLVDYHEESHRLRADLEAEGRRLATEVERRQLEIQQRSRAKDPLGAIFRVRGVLLRSQGIDGVPRFYVHFGGEATSELVCASGRYDMEVFAGYEVGVLGTALAAADPSGPPVLEVGRIEVLARR